jgi:CheY-like chemotaxis protein
MRRANYHARGSSDIVDTRPPLELALLARTQLRTSSSFVTPRTYVSSRLLTAAREPAWFRAVQVDFRRACASSTTAPSTGVRVLVVDDNVDAAQTLRDFLDHLGHEAALAHDAVEALELASSFKPDVAMLDIGLPVMDGYELARRLREQLGFTKLRPIAVTGYGQDSDRLRARQAGFDHHLVKPITLEALVPLLAAAP